MKPQNVKMERRTAIKRTALILGYAVSGSALSGVLNGCKADTHPDWTPEFFTSEQFQTIGAIAECILPKTDTPGAKDLFVDRFVDKMLKMSYAEADQQSFLEGMAAFEEDCKAMNGKAFAKCSAEQQTTTLKKYETQSAPVPPTVWGGQLGTFDPVPFYRQLKALVLLGYFTSEEVGENLLAYQPIPGKYVGCKPLSEVGKAWSL